jgi:DNA polymerase-3 subunit alpha
MGQFDLFGSAASAPDAEVADSSPLAHLRYLPEEWPRKQLLAYEREMLGLYVSAHPLDGAQRLLAAYQDTSIADLVGGERDTSKEQVKIAGIISGLQRRINKNGIPWAIATVEDLDAGVEVLFFPKSYEVFADLLTEDASIAVKGRVNERDGAISVVASEAVPVDISAAESEPADLGDLPFMLRVDPDKLDRNAVTELRSALQAHRGVTPVHVVVDGRRCTRMLLPDYSVAVCNELLMEINKGVRGVTVEQSA